MSFSVGEELRPFVIESVSAAAMKEWAVFLHDPNPIHLDPEVVKAKGLGDKVINQGPANVAYIMNMLTASIPGGFIKSLLSKFVDNVYAGDRLTAGGTVTAVESGLISTEFWLKADGRGTVITGNATIQVPV